MKVASLLFVSVLQAPSCPLTVLTEMRISPLPRGQGGVVDFICELGLEFVEYSHHGKQSLEASRFPEK